MNTAQNAAQRPVYEIRIGLTKAAIWRNSNDQQRSWFSVSFNRSYKSGTEWKSTANFGLGDLLELAKLADMAHSWILENQREDSTAHLAETETQSELNSAPKLPSVTPTVPPSRSAPMKPVPSGRR